jgi:hypothetical protein
LRSALFRRIPVGPILSRPVDGEPVGRSRWSRKRNNAVAPRRPVPAPTRAGGTSWSHSHLASPVVLLYTATYETIVSRSG